VMAFGQIVMTKMAIDNGVAPLPAIALGMLACVAFGFLNGGLVSGLRLPAFIVTLGTLNIAFALTHVYSQDLTYPPGSTGASSLPSEMLFFGRTFSLGGGDWTYGVVLMFALYGVMWFVLSQTGWGRHVYAVGDNLEAARLTGIKTSRVLLSVYTAAGLTYGIASWLLVSPHRARGSERGSDDGEARRHHGRRPRRDEPVRRPRHGDRHADRSRDRRRLPERADADRRRGHLPVPRHGHPRHPRGLGRSAHAPETAAPRRLRFSRRAGSSSATGT